MIGLNNYIFSKIFRNINTNKIGTMFLLVIKHQIIINILLM